MSANCDQHVTQDKILLEEKTPISWSEVIVTLIHKDGNKLNPANYPVISLMLTPGKVFNHVLLRRMKIHGEQITCDNQFGFRQNRGTVDAIFIVRQILEKAREHNLVVHLYFVDFKAAFDKLWRKALWKM